MLFLLFDKIFFLCTLNRQMFHFLNKENNKTIDTSNFEIENVYEFAIEYRRRYIDPNAFKR